MINPKLFPTVLVVLDIASSACYFYACDWRKGIYWLAAAVLTFVVTY